MHEFHAVEDIFKQALQKAREQKARKVTRLTLAVGELLSFDPGSIKLYFEDLAEGTMLEGAELLVHTCKPKLRCKDCDNSFEKQSSQLTCPTCCSAALILLSGKEFYIESLDIEVD